LKQKQQYPGQGVAVPSITVSCFGLFLFTGRRRETKTQIGQA